MELSKEFIPITGNRFPTYSLVSDFWGFIDFKIKEAHDKQAEAPLEPINFEIVKDFIAQARSYQDSAKQATYWVAKPVLYYYSFLNFVKVLLYLDNAFNKKDAGFDLRGTFNHGISDSDYSSNRSIVSDKVTVYSSIDSHGSRSGFAALESIISPIRILTATGNKGIQYPVMSVLSGVTCVAQPVSNSKILKILELEGTHPWRKGDRDLFKFGTENDPRILFDIDRGPPDSRLSSEVKAVSCLLSNEGTSVYAYTDPNAINQLSAIYLLMFYLGSVSRYNPYLLSGSSMSPLLQWIFKEFLQLSPYQFYYQSLQFAINSGVQFPKSNSLF